MTNAIEKRLLDIDFAGLTRRTFTPSPARIRIFLEEAATRKVRVTLRPFLDERRLLPSWRSP